MIFSHHNGSMSLLRPGAFGDERAAMAMSAPLETVRDPMMGAFFEPTALCILKSSRTNRLAPGDVDGERFDSVGLLGQFDQGGRLSQVQNPAGRVRSVLITMWPTAADQQVSSLVQITSDWSGTQSQYGYSFDKAGNRTGFQSDLTVASAQANWLNQLTQVTTGQGPLTVFGNTNRPSTVSVNGVSAKNLPNNSFSAQTIRLACVLARMITCMEPALSDFE